jgi:hypothetical protein
MNVHDIERASEIIRKLLAKAGNNSNQHEVESCMLKAQEISIKYNIDIESLNFEDKPNKEAVDEAVTDYLPVVWWHWNLAVILGKNFRSKPYVDNWKRKRKVYFIGLKEDVQIIRDVFNFAMSSIEYNAKKFVNELVYKYNNTYREHMTVKDFEDFKNDYIKGFISGIDAKFKEQVEKNNWGLILVQDKAVIELVKTKHFSKGKGSNYKEAHSNGAFDKGYKDGFNMGYGNKQIR